MTKQTTITTSNDVTGRDGSIIRKALAYAIEAIDRLPQKWQEGGDRCDMQDLLEALGNAEYYRVGARSHLTRRGLALESGGLALADAPAGVVVPIIS